MFKKVLHLTFIVCVFSLFLYQNVSYGYSKAWKTEETELITKKDAVTTAQTNLQGIRGDLEELIDVWEQNADSIKMGSAVALAATGGAIISATAAIYSGGTLAPAAWAAYLGIKATISASSGSVANAELRRAMGDLITLLDQALSGINTAYDAYLTQYKRYIKQCSDHKLIRFDANNNPSAVYT